LLAIIVAESEEDLSERELVHERLAKLVVRTGRLELSLILPTDAEPKRLDLPWSAPASRRKREIVGPPAEGSERRPMRAEARARLLEALAKAHLWLDGLIAGRFTSTAALQAYRSCPSSGRNSYPSQTNAVATRRSDERSTVRFSANRDARLLGGIPRAPSPGIPGAPRWCFSAGRLG
jgi:hypothetical protein